MVYFLIPFLIGIFAILLYSFGEFICYLIDSAFVPLDSLTIMKIKERFIKKCSH